MTDAMMMDAMDIAAVAGTVTTSDTATATVRPSLAPLVVSRGNSGTGSSLTATTTTMTAATSSTPTSSSAVTPPSTADILPMPDLARVQTFIGLPMTPTSRASLISPTAAHAAAAASAPHTTKADGSSLHHARLPTISSPFTSTRTGSMSETFTFQPHSSTPTPQLGTHCLSSTVSSTPSTPYGGTSPPCTCAISHTSPAHVDMLARVPRLSLGGSTCLVVESHAQQHQQQHQQHQHHSVEFEALYPNVLPEKSPRSSLTDSASTAATNTTTSAPLYTLHVPDAFDWNENGPLIYGGARQGGKPRQEDCFFSFVAPSRRIYVGAIFDGHGGVNGQVSSNMARNVARVFCDVHQHAMETWSVDEWSSRLKRLFAEMHEQIRVQLALGRTVASNSFRPSDRSLFVVSAEASGVASAGASSIAGTAESMLSAEGIDSILSGATAVPFDSPAGAGVPSASVSASTTSSSPSSPIFTSVCYAQRHGTDSTSTTPTVPSPQAHGPSTQHHSRAATTMSGSPASRSHSSSTSSAVHSPSLSAGSSTSSSASSSASSASSSASRNYVDARGIVRDSTNQPVHGGTTASIVVALLPKEGSAAAGGHHGDAGEITLISANVGDSHALLTNDRDEWAFLTEDHSPDNPHEFLRVQSIPDSMCPRKLQFVYDTVRSVRKSECPLVFLPDGRKDPYYLDDPWRKGIHPTNMRFEPAVYAVSPHGVVVDLTCIAMTRALGDFYAHQFGLTWEPSIGVKTVRLLREGEERGSEQQQQSSVVAARSFTVCIASDGVWDCWTYRDVAVCLDRAAADETLDGAAAASFSKSSASASTSATHSKSVSSRSGSVVAASSPSSSTTATTSRATRAGRFLLERSIQLGITHFGPHSFDDASLVVWRFGQ